MFTLDSDRFYRVPAFGQFPWLVHGFGTRSASPPVRGLATMRQVHSAAVLITDTPGPSGTGDALISDVSGVLPAVKTADCFPILIVDPVHRAVAAVHAGWRGTAQNIVGNTVRALQEKFGTQPEEVHAAIGPGIGLCCFEVGPEVASELTSSPSKSDRKIHLDLSRINRHRLEQAGVGKIYGAALCTFCEEREFFSYRREGEQAGRMISYVGIA